MQQELQRISAEMQLSAGAATLYRTGGAAALIQVGTVPVQITDFDDLNPKRYYQNVEPDLGGQAIYIQNEGIWMGAFTITAEVESQRRYECRLFMDDLATDLAHFVDPSNQTTIATLTAIGSVRLDLNEGARKLDLRVTADTAGSDWRFLGGYFTLWWAGE